MDHKDMLEGSPYYAAIVDRYGRRVSEQVAARIAKDHGFSLADLHAEGLSAKKAHIPVSNWC